MRMMWRGLELPGRVSLDRETSDDSYGRFTIEPFEQGFGTTIGNSLRRVLLSSLEGAAITSVKIEGVSHEFACIDGVVEDVTDILLNIKGIVVRYDGEEPTTMSLARDEAGEVRAGDITCGPSLEIVNPDHLIATLTVDVPFHAEFRVARGRGYATAVDNRSPEQELGIIPVDSIFAPVIRVRYTTEAMRVGQRTNYDRLILEVWTNGSVRPEDALVEAALILRKHLNPFVMYHDIGEETVAHARHVPVEVSPSGDAARDEFLDKPLTVLNLSVRASNCLEAAKVHTLRELVTLTEGDLLRFRSFGKTSLHEVHRKLADVGLTLGMKLDDATSVGGAGPEQNASAADTPVEQSAEMEAYPGTAPDTSGRASSGSAAPSSDESDAAGRRDGASPLGDSDHTTRVSTFGD